MRILPTGPGTQGPSLAQGGSKMVPASGSFTLLQPPGTKTPSAALGPDSVLAPVSDKPPLVLVVDKPKTVLVVEKPATDPLLSKPSPVPGLDKPSAVLLADKTKVVSAKDKPTTDSGPSAVLENSPEVQKLSDKPPEVPAVPVLEKPLTTVVPEEHSASPATDESSVLTSGDKSTTVLSSDDAPGVPLQDKSSTVAIPVSDKPSKDPVLDKPPAVPVSEGSTAVSVQNKQDSSGTDVTAESSVCAPIVLSSKHSSSSDSSLTSPVKADQLKPTSPPKDASPEDRNTASAEALKGNSDTSKPSASSVSLPSSHPQADKTAPDGEPLLFKEMLDLTPLSPSVEECEAEEETVDVDSDDHEEEECIVLTDGKPMMEEGEIGSDVEVLGDTLLLTDDSDEDSDSDDESVCVISVRF